MSRKRNLQPGTVIPRDPERLETLDDLPQRMRLALLRCYTQQVREADPKGIHPATIAALQRRELIELKPDKLRRPCWKPTDKAFAVITAETPRYLAAKSQHGYTSDPAKGLRDAGQAVDAATQERITADARQKPRHTQAEMWAETRADLTAQLERLRSIELTRDVFKDVTRIEAAIKSIDRKVAA